MKLTGIDSNFVPVNPKPTLNRKNIGSGKISSNVSLRIDGKSIKPKCLNGSNNKGVTQN